jgi:hypothetical protein
LLPQFRSLSFQATICNLSQARYKLDQITIHSIDKPKSKRLAIWSVINGVNMHVGWGVKVGVQKQGWGS